jgi:hypothetical protein
MLKETLQPQANSTLTHLREKNKKQRKDYTITPRRSTPPSKKRPVHSSRNRATARARPFITAR